jgi:hypothetical protein
MHDQYLCFYIVNFDNVPYVSCCVKILHDLSVSVYVNGVCEHHCECLSRSCAASWLSSPSWLSVGPARSS